mgnify:CR=1 FL=1
MNYIKKLSKSLLISIISFIILLTINTLFIYLNIFKGNIITITNIIIPILSIFIGSFILGNNISKKGWLEGLKLGILYIIFYTIINLIIYNNFNIKLLLYYSILVIGSILGGMIGITKKRKNINFFLYF